MTVASISSTIVLTRLVASGARVPGTIRIDQGCGSSCRRIFGGRLWVESTPGSGTTFYFTLPVA